jgi:cob(I)alamin adenosyltransferase
VKIYTKTGDDGTTGLQNNKRISKSNPRIQAYGAVDEINSFLGVILSSQIDEDIKNMLTTVQNDLFVVGSDLSNSDLSASQNRITEKMVEFLEKNIDHLEKDLPSITNFILPGGHPTASWVHVARAITRRAETQIILLSENEKINKNCIKYLNRLSDFLFVVARTINKRNQINDVLWKP